MAILPIRTVPDPVLRQKAKRVKAIDKSVRKLISDMQETLQTATGVGLAANQVGETVRLIVLNVPGADCKVLINPEVTRRIGTRVVNEGCLSIPGYIGEIKRSELVRVKGQNAPRAGSKNQSRGVVSRGAGARNRPFERHTLYRPSGKSGQIPETGTAAETGRSGRH